jgi:hypothetical protein
MVSGMKTAREAIEAGWEIDVSREAVDLDSRDVVAFVEARDTEWQARVSALEGELAAARGARKAVDAECAATMADMAAMRGDLEFLRRVCAQVIIVPTLAPGEELAEPIPHAVVDAALGLRGERDRYRKALERIKLGDVNVPMEWSAESSQREADGYRRIASAALSPAAAPVEPKEPAAAPLGETK